MTEFVDRLKQDLRFGDTHAPREAGLRRVAVLSIALGIGCFADWRHACSRFRLSELELGRDLGKDRLAGKT